MSNYRDEAISRIRAGLKRRSGHPWSVTHDRGTASGWLTIDVPPKLRTWTWKDNGRKDEDGRTAYDEVNDGGQFGHMGPDARAELGRLLGLSHVHHQGVSIPAGHDYYDEYIARAEGRTPERYGEQYWD